MVEQQKFVHGFIEGWHSVVGPRLDFPEIPSPPIQGSGSDYFRGLVAGIEAAKTKAPEATLVGLDR